MIDGAQSVGTRPECRPKGHGADCGKTLYRRLTASVMHRRRETAPCLQYRKCGWLQRPTTGGKPPVYMPPCSCMRRRRLHPVQIRASFFGSPRGFIPCPLGQLDAWGSQNTGGWVFQYGIPKNFKESCGSSGQVGVMPADLCKDRSHRIRGYRKGRSPILQEVRVRTSCQIRALEASYRA